jgi:chromosome partitioning protein
MHAALEATHSSPRRRATRESESILAIPLPERGTRMKVLSLVTRKGGTGKSTFAVSMSVAAQQKGLAACVLDVDPQGTAAAWSQRRSDSKPAVVAMHWSRLSSQIHGLDRDGYDLAIVDTPGADDATTAAAMREADFCLIPVRASVADIEAAKPSLRYLIEREKPFAFVLNQCVAGGLTSRTANAFRGLTLLGCVAEITLALRTDHMDALACGLGVTEFARTGKAAAETRALLDWVLTRMH